ncbi:HPP family protein [Streptomyces sp. NBC_01077]|uniref:HPP family protein n=1 Tax=Streptomyces sp. NBC_01077 TaxID=2903746 RepID=UPI00386A875F
MLIPPLAASAALVHCAPALPLAQSRSVVVGHLLGAAAGYAVALAAHMVRKPRPRGSAAARPTGRPPPTRCHSRRRGPRPRGPRKVKSSARKSAAKRDCRRRLST